jgi:hypothetical protein
MSPPKISDAPGSIWRKHTMGWECRWQARTDLVQRGFLPKSQQVYVGEQPNETETAYIQDTCRRLQDEMLVWGRGGIEAQNQFDGSLKSLVRCYQTDPDSTYHKLRYKVRLHSDSLCKRLITDHGHEDLGDIKGRTILSWHRTWTGGDDMKVGPKIAMGSAFVGKLRTLFTFGRSILEIEECRRLGEVMHDLKFEGTKSRKVRITAQQADAVRYMARLHFGWYSISLGQAFQFECTLRQKDVVGEWVPIAEEGVSDVIDSGEKWLRGIRWEEIDDNLILRHVTSKKQKPVVVDLKLAPMVIEELVEYARGQQILVTDQVTKKVTVNRQLLPTAGPVLICDTNGLPWTDAEYRRKWRLVANACGLPKNVWNMDSRSGAISEGIAAGANIEWVRHAATHSDISQTADYDRTQEESTAKVMKLRVADRNKPKTE